MPNPPLADTLTILFCESPGCSATKRHKQTDDTIETVPYNAGFLFTARTYRVRNIFKLAAFLAALEKIPVAFVIRGAPTTKLGRDLKTPHQRLKEHYTTPAPGRRYVMVDIDKLPLPDDLELTQETLAEVLSFVVKQLPTELRDVTHYWQLSASAGIGDPTKISVHLWFWLSQPVTDADLIRWGKAVNSTAGFKLIDISLFRDVQPHFLASPLFENMDDPFPCRSGLVEKCHQHATLQLPPTPEPVGTDSKNKRSTPSPSQGFSHLLTLIGDHDGGEGFHEPIIRAAASYVATHGCDADDSEHLYQILRERILAADRSKHSTAEVEQRASREHLKSAIDSAIVKFGDTPTGGARLKDGIPPHYAAATSTKTKAAAKLDRLLKKIL